MQDLHDSGKKLTTEKIILQATRKYHNLIQRNQCHYNASKKYLNFTANKSNNNDAIAEWRKTEILGQPIVERDGRTFYWCSHHKVPSRGFPNGSYVCSHKPENHEAWAAKNYRNKKGAPSKEDSPATDNKLVMTDKLRRVLTTTQPALSAAQIDDFISEVLKE